MQLWSEARDVIYQTFSTCVFTKTTLKKEELRAPHEILGIYLRS
jgi:hypothetical protein